MPLVCNGIFGTPLLCGKPDAGPTKPSIAASRYSAVLRQQVGLRPIAALIGRNCCWRLQPSGLCRAATVVAETREDQHSPRSSIQQQRVVFRTTHQVKYGEVIKIVGQGPQLGKWEVSGAPAMEWSEGDHWCLEVDLFPGMTDFKCAVVRQDGSVVCWEPGANRTVEVPHVNGGSAVHVKCTWSNTGNTIQALSMDEDDTADFPVDSMDEEDHHETTFMRHSSVHATSSAPNNDTDSPMVPGGGDKQAERGDRQGEYGDVDDEDMERANTGEMERNRERVQQQGDGGGGKQATTSLPGKSEKGQERDQAGVEDDNSQKQDLAPGQGVQLDEVEGGNDELAENPASSRNPKPGTPKAFSNQQQGASDSTHSTGHLAAGLAGLAAVPIVAWSEYTLKTSGCGLPPGPGGLLGAAEGVAYLTVAALTVWSLSTKLLAGRSLPKGPGGVLAGAEKLAFTTALAGIAVLGSQIKDYGYIPGTLPDANCFGAASSSSSSSYVASSPISNSQPVPAVFVSRITELSRSAFPTGPAPDASSNTVALGPASSSSASQTSRAPRTDHTEPSRPPQPDPFKDGDPTPINTRFSDSAAQSTEAAKKSAGDLWTSLRATYNSVAETISELDFTPLGKQATFVKDTLGAGFAGLGKSAVVLSQQLAQDVTKNSQGIPSELQNRSEEVYSGAVDGLSSSDVNAVVEELENEYNMVKREVERDAETVRKAFQKAMHRAMGSVALLGTPSLQESFHQGMPASSSSVVKHASMTPQQPMRHKRVHQPLLGGVSIHSPVEQEPVLSLQVSGMVGVSGLPADANCAVSSLRLPVPSPFSRAQTPSRHFQPLWGQQEVATRVLELSVRTMSAPLAQVSLDFPALDLHRLLVEANMMMMGAAATNAVSAANNVNTTLGNAIQQLRVTVDTLKQTVNDVCTIAHRDRVDLNRLYKAVANLDNLLGGAKMTATSVELAPMAHQLDDAAASIRANESGVEADQLAGRLVKAATILRDTSSSISVTATLENAQRIVSKIPETAANEEDIAPLLQEFEDLTAQLQAELDKLSAVTTNISPSSL